MDTAIVPLRTTCVSQRRPWSTSLTRPFDASRVARAALLSRQVQAQQSPLGEVRVTALAKGLKATSVVLRAEG